jgi:hypothetical protein
MGRYRVLDDTVIAGFELAQTYAPVSAAQGLMCAAYVIPYKSLTLSAVDVFLLMTLGTVVCEGLTEFVSGTEELQCLTEFQLAGFGH